MDSPLLRHSLTWEQGECWLSGGQQLGAVMLYAAAHQCQVIDWDHGVPFEREPDCQQQIKQSISSMRSCVDKDTVAHECGVQHAQLCRQPIAAAQLDLGAG